MSHDGNPHPNARQVEKGGEAVPEVVIRMRAIALRLGWSIGIHGSMARDYDMIAVPWSKEAAPWRADYVSTYAVELCGLQGGIWLKYEAYSLTTLAEVRKGITAVTKAWRKS